MKLSANTAFYPKWMDTFAASIGKSNVSGTIMEPESVRTYAPSNKPPIPRPPANTDSSAYRTAAGYANTMGNVVMKHMIESSPASSYLEKSKSALLTAAKDYSVYTASKIPEMVAPDVASMIPILVVAPNPYERVSAAAEIRRYEIV